MDKNNFSTTVAKNLKKHIDNYKDKFNLTQDKIARDVLHIDPTLLSKKLKGHTAISLADIECFSEALGISCYEILGREEAPDANIILLSKKLSSLTSEQQDDALEILNIFYRSVKHAS